MRHTPARLVGLSVRACLGLAVFAASAWVTAATLADDDGLRPINATVPASSQPMDPVIARIRDEGLNHSHVQETLDYLCNAIGARLTGTPSARRASNWTRDTLEKWGLSNAHLESWTGFGRGWTLERYAMQVTKPYTIIVTGYPKAWSPGFDHPIEAPVVYVDAANEEELEAFKGKLKGQIVLLNTPHQVVARDDMSTMRMDEGRLDRLSNLPMGASPSAAASQPASAPAKGTVPPTAALATRTPAEAAAMPSTAPATGPASRPHGRTYTPAQWAARLFNFVAEEGASVVLTPSNKSDHGLLFAAQITMPTDLNAPTSQPFGTVSTRPKAWSLDAPAVPAQVLITIEDFNRLTRMIALGEKPEVSLTLQVKYHTEDPLNYNTIAEIPGTDLKDEVVMVGAHLDSWHSGTGATDNAVGAAAAMEAVRIIKALNLHSRRTIRVALWTGEEEGLLGSTAYVKRHFGYTVPTSQPATTGPAATRRGGAATGPASQPAVPIVKGAEYEKLSVYFNLDNGTGKIRGIYGQSNPRAIPLFNQWLKPLADLGATATTITNTGSTDHISFDRIGLPGFQFVQDPIEYNNRTHHSNADVYDRIEINDMKQAATIMAAFVWDAANMDQRFPRKPEPPTATTPATQPEK